MSHQGKLKRGCKWYSFRNREGILPKGITKDSSKMEDVNYFLNYLKERDVKEEDVKDDILKLRKLERDGKMRTPEYKEMIEKIGIREKPKSTGKK